MLHIRADVRRLYPSGNFALCLLLALLSPRYHPVLLYRLTQACLRLRLAPLAYVLSYVNLVLYRVEIALRSEIGPGLEIPHGNCVIGALRIGSGFSIFQGCTIGSRAGNLENPQEPVGEDRPVIGDNVVMYANSVVVGPIVIGSNCTIGANTLVMQNMADGQVARCAPAMIEARRS